MVAPVSVGTGVVIFEPTREDKLIQSIYRLDAIARHVDQHPKLSEKRREEFRAEIAKHLANLAHVNRIFEVDLESVLEKIGV